MIEFEKKGLLLHVSGKLVKYFCIGRVRSITGCICGACIAFIPAFFLGILIATHCACTGAEWGGYLLGKTGCTLGYFVVPFVVLLFIIFIFELVGMTMGNYIGAFLKFCFSKIYRLIFKGPKNGTP